MPSAAGHDSRVVYYWEDDGSFNQSPGTPSDSTAKTFGANIEVTTLEGSNNALRVFGDPTSREATNVIEQNFEGSVSVEFTLTNPWWAQFIFGDFESSGSSPTTHTPTDSVPKTGHIIVGQEQADNERTLTGVYFTSATIRTQVPGEARVSLEGAYADEENSTTLTETQQTTSQRPLMFHQGEVSVGGNTKSLVQSVQVSIENNIDGIGEVGSRFWVDYSPKVRAVTLNYGDIVDDETELHRMYGGSTAPGATVENTDSATVAFNNGKSGSNKNSFSVDMTLSFPDTYARSGTGNPEADLEGDITEVVGQVDCTAENNSSSAV